MTLVRSWQVAVGADHGRAGFWILRPGVTHTGPSGPAPHRQVRSAIMPSHDRPASRDTAQRLLLRITPSPIASVPARRDPKVHSSDCRALQKANYSLLLGTARALLPPFGIMHGSSDVSVPPSIAEDFAEELQVCALLQYAESAVSRQSTVT